MDNVCGYHLFSNASYANTTTFNTSLPLLDLLGANMTASPGNPTLSRLHYVNDQILLPVVLFCGIIGNAISVGILRRKRLRHTFDEVEKSATSGLVCLSISDMAFCSTGFLSIVMPSNYTILNEYSNWAIVSMYYNNFKGPLLNIFLLTSTWLVIAISFARYVAIANPFKATSSWMIHKRRIIHGCIFLASIIINLPQFFHFRIKHGPCHHGCYCYFRVPWFHRHVTWYHGVWHILGTIIPFITLVYCNSRLLHQIYASLHGAPHRYSTSKLTLILVTIISLFLLLVFPSMILTFLSDVIKYNTHLQMATSLTNLLQTINFAINFILYACISKQFRQTFLQILFCVRNTKPKQTRQINYPMVRMQIRS